jgi:ABC-type nitrate/sulfonate/bicarbonate transport system substrate-binding protein
VVIAYDQGLYKKNGLDVTLWMPPAQFPGAIEMGGKHMDNPEFSIDGGVPMMTDIISNNGPKRIILASTGCEVPRYIIGQKGMKSLEELKGKRLGVLFEGDMSDFAARLLAQRMGWKPGKDISIVEHGAQTKDLESGKVDAMVSAYAYLAMGNAADFPILADTSTWKESIAGNSVRVDRTWWQDPKNRETARRFLKATIEGIAIYNQNRAEALRVMAKYHGFKDPKVAGALYEEKMLRKPYPCYEGIKKTMELYDSAEMRKYKATDFYDDSLVKELDKSGFIDQLYK